MEGVLIISGHHHGLKNQLEKKRYAGKPAAQNRFWIV
jgi:hypothetical protein